MSENMEAGASSVAAWQVAIKNRPIHKPLLFHSDSRGAVCLPGIQGAVGRNAGAAAHELKGELLSITP